MSFDLLARIRAAVYFAQVDCVSHEHRPVCFLNADGTRCALQPCTYGG